MSTLLQFIKKVSLTGIKGVYDQRLRFEIISVNQLCMISIALTFAGALFFFVLSPNGLFQLLLLLFAALFLPTFFLNREGNYFLAKLVPILNVQVFYFLVSLDFGLDSQAQGVYLLAIAYVLLFFTRQHPLIKALLVTPSILFPILLFYFENHGIHLHWLLDFAEPLYLGATTYMLTLIAAIALSLIVVANMNMIERRLNKTRIDLINANAHLRSETSKMAEEIRAAAHDLKSPVASAVSLSELLNVEQDEEERKLMQQHLERSLTKLKKYVDEILADKDAGRELMELRTIDFNNEINEVLDLVKHYPGFRKINISIEVEQNAPLVSDKKYLHVILSNLLSNAIKYADNSKPQSFIIIKSTIDADRMEIEVEDNGIGIPEQNLPHVFRKNVRATEVPEGTGLGLSLVKRTVQILDGNIEINSAKGKGTTAKLYINNFTTELHD